MYDVDAVRRDFPILAREVHGRPLVYLDNGASAQKPQAVIDAVTKAYAHEYANVHRGLHYLSSVATEKYEAHPPHRPALPRRRRTRRRSSSPPARPWRSTSSATPGPPRASSGRRRDRPLGDGAPRQHRPVALPARAPGRRAEVGRHRARRLASIPRRCIAAIGPRTKLVAVTHMSNVLGTVVDVKAICAGAQARACRCSSTAARRRCTWPWTSATSTVDFYAITGHKLYGPTGSGALYAKREHLERDASLPRRRRHDPRGPQGRGQLRRPAAALRGGHAVDRRRRSGSAWRSTT